MYDVYDCMKEYIRPWKRRFISWVYLFPSHIHLSYNFLDRNVSVMTYEISSMQERHAQRDLKMQQRQTQMEMKMQMQIRSHNAMKATHIEE